MKLYPSDRIVCDAEIGRAGHWHACRRRAVVRVHRHCGADRYYNLDYCARHRARVDVKPAMVTSQTVETLPGRK